MLYESESWPLRKENELALQWAEMRMVRWMCGMKLQDRVSSKGLRDRLGLDDKTSCDGMGMSSEKKTMIWWRNVWRMKWRVSGQEVDQRKLGERLWKKTVRCMY